MQTPVLQTRLKPPSLPEGLILRPELLDKLNRGSGHKLTLLSAPAGYGKTILAVQWLKTLDRTNIWLSIDPIHRDSRVFLQYILSALSFKYDEFNNPFWQIPQQKAQWDPRFLLGHLINQIDQLDTDIVLVLDDYHLIDNDEINEILGYLLDNLPPRMNVLMLSRNSPQLSLAKMRAKQDLVEIRINDLQFDKRDTERFIFQNQELTLRENEIREICEKSEGWITGIQLALMAYGRNASDPATYVYDYLFEEMLEKEEEHLVSFLYKTSILTYLNAPLCDSLVPELQGKSHEILTELMKKNFFIKAVDMEGEWYRLHSLLLEVLIKKRTCNPRNLHLRAAQWFWEREQYGESLHHFISSGDYSLAISHLELCWPEMERNFNHLTWLKWTEDIPENVKNSHPLLLSQIAWAHLNLGQLKTCEILLRKLEKQFGSGEADKALSIQINSAWSYLSFAKRDLGKTLEYADKLERLAGVEDSFTLMEARSYKALTLWLEGNLDEAFLSFESFRDEMMAAGVPAFALGSSMALIQIRMQQGRSGVALELYEEAMGMITDSDEQLDKVRASLHLKAAVIYFERGDQNLSSQCLAMSENLSRTDSLVDYHYQLHQFKALVYESEGKWEKALNELNEAEHLFVQTPAIDDLTIGEQKLRIWIRMKKKTTAKKALRDLSTGSDPFPSFLFESRLVISIRYTLEFFRDPEELEPILGLLDQLSGIARKEGRERSLIVILILKAQALYELNRKSDSYELLCELLNLVESMGLYQILLLESDSFLPIFREFAGKLKKIESYQIIKDLIESNRKSNQLLSSRELEVLQFMAAGLSNKSIGEKLFVAESTVKGHNQRIFQKLNVAKRTEAIAEGRKMGLID